MRTGCFGVVLLKKKGGRLAGYAEVLAWARLQLLPERALVRRSALKGGSERCRVHFRMRG